MCGGCKEKRRLEGRTDCPTCRVAMREAISVVVIENMDHGCDLEGCYEVVPYNQYKTHQEKCNFRLVPCPGNL